jgi:hypothetical protein
LFRCWSEFNWVHQQNLKENPLKGMKNGTFWTALGADVQGKLFESNYSCIF